MASPPRPLILFTSGAPFSPDAWALCALDETVEWCEEREKCHEHQRLGPHIRGGLLDWRPLEVDRGATVDVTRFDYGSFAVEDVRDLSNDRVRWPDALIDLLSRADAIVYVIEARLARLARQVHKLHWVERDLRLVGRDPRRVPLVFQIDRDDLDPAALNPRRRGVDDETIRSLFRWPGPTDYIRTVSYRREHAFAPLDRAVELAVGEDSLPDERLPAESPSRADYEARWGVEVVAPPNTFTAALAALQEAEPLEPLLGAWRVHPFCELAEAIELVSEHVGPHRPLEDQELEEARAWTEGEADAPLPDVPGDFVARLLATFPRLRRAEDVALLVQASRRHGPDPRIREACRRWLVDFDRFRKDDVWRAYRGVPDIAEANRDPRSLVDLDLALADAVRSTVPPAGHLNPRLRAGWAQSMEQLLGEHDLCPIRWKLDEGQALAWGDGVAPWRVRRDAIARCHEDVATSPLAEALPRAAARLRAVGEPSGDLIAHQLGDTPSGFDAERAELAFRHHYLRPLADLVDALVPHRSPGFAELHLPFDVRIEGGALRACALRFNNLRRVRELTGHPAWATLEALHWGSDPFLRPQHLEPSFLAHPVLARLEHLAGLDEATVDALVAAERPWAFRHLEARALRPDQLADPSRWPRLESLQLGRPRLPRQLTWLATSEVGSQLRRLTLRAAVAGLGDWLALAADLPQLEELVLVGRHRLHLRRSDGWRLVAEADGGHRALPYERGSELAAELTAALEKGTIEGLAAIEVRGVEHEPENEVQALAALASTHGANVSGVPGATRGPRLVLGPGRAAHTTQVAVDVARGLAAFAMGGVDTINDIAVERPDGEVWTRSLDAPWARSMAFRADGALLVLDGEKGLSTFDAETGEHRRPRHTLPQHFACLSADGERLALQVDGAVEVHSTRDGETLQRVEVEEVFDLWIDATGDHVGCRNRHAPLEVFVVDDGSSALTVRSVGGRLDTVCFAGDRVLCAYWGSSPVEEWSLTTGELVRRIPFRSMSYRLTMSPDERWLISCTGTTIEVWDAPAARRVSSVDAHCNGLAFLAGGDVALASTHRWARWVDDTPA